MLTGEEKPLDFVPVKMEPKEKPDTLIKPELTSTVEEKHFPLVQVKEEAVTLTKTELKSAQPHGMASHLSF